MKIDRALSGRVEWARVVEGTKADSCSDGTMSVGAAESHAQGTSLSLAKGDRVLGNYRMDQYRATVLQVDGEDVVIEWAPPHNKWGPATLKRRDVEFVSRPKAEDPLAHLLPGRLVNGSGEDVELSEAYDGCDAIGLYFVTGETRPSATEELVRCRERLAANGMNFGLALVEFEPLPETVNHHRSHFPKDCLSIPLSNVGLVTAHFNLMEACRIRSFPSLCVVTRQGAVLTYDGMEAMAEDPDGFPWKHFKSKQTRRIQLKAKVINFCTRLAAFLLFSLGAYRVLGMGYRFLRWASGFIEEAPAAETAALI